MLYRLQRISSASGLITRLTVILSRTVRPMGTAPLPSFSLGLGSPGASATTSPAAVVGVPVGRRSESARMPWLRGKSQRHYQSSGTKITYIRTIGSNSGGICMCHQCCSRRHVDRSTMRSPSQYRLLYKSCDLLYAPS